jgi:hypothetical protein
MNFISKDFSDRTSGLYGGLLKSIGDRSKSKICSLWHFLPAHNKHGANTGKDTFFAATKIYIKIQKSRPCSIWRMPVSPAYRAVFFLKR